MSRDNRVPCPLTRVKADLKITFRLRESKPAKPGERGTCGGAAVFKGFCTLMRPMLGALLALSLLGFAGGSKALAANSVIDCTSGPGPNMTIVLYNNSADFNVYPVLFAGAASATDEWMQACFRIPYNQIMPDQPTDYPYARASQYRMYVNCCAPGENGIPPGGSVTITLPFYSPLVAKIDPKGTAQFIDWWQGGGINVYKTPKEATTRPPELQAHWNQDQAEQRAVTPHSNPPTCNAGCNLHFFSSISIANWEPQQLLEYTLGAAPEDAQRKSATDPRYLWVPDNVDYDVSNVNFAYMPAAMEPYGNTLNDTCCAIGWVGSTARIADVDQALANWRNSPLGSGWPLYVNQNSTTNPKATVPGKVPSTLEIFLSYLAFDNTNNFSPAPSKSPQIVRMKALWEDCRGGQKYNICARVNDVTDLLQANYDNWVKVYNTDKQKWTKTWGCKAPPVKLTEAVMLGHLYGWSPFNADSGCSARANLLEQTPGYDPANKTVPVLKSYADVKSEYDQLQYWFDVADSQYGQWTDSTAPDYGQFDPYVGLVHGKDFMNAPFTYAYSVDDAVGNMQTDGTGLIVAVGGPERLPNPNHVTSEVKFTFGYKSSYAGGITFDKYGRCITAPDTDTVSYYTTFVVPEGVNSGPNSVKNCQITLRDSKNRSYTFRLKGFPTDFPKPVEGQKNWPDAKQIPVINKQFIDCSGNTNQDVQLSWCKLIYTYQKKDLSNPHLPTNYYVIMGAPAPCDRDPEACRNTHGAR